jgi:hypothetical protein
MTSNLYKTHVATDLVSAVRFCLELRKTDFWSFRGQRDPAWSLGLHGHEDVEYLDVYLDEFCRRCREFAPPHYIEENNRWRWLFFAQHHRLKTRLLDWSKDPLVAIYFAVEDIISRPVKDSPPGAVWALHVPPQYFKQEDELKRPAEEKQWIMVNASPITSRLARQSGLFTFHPGPRGRTAIDSIDRRPGEQLVKITFKTRPNFAAEVRGQLGILNVHHGSLFPDPQGIAEFIGHEWPLIALEEYLRRTAPPNRGVKRAGGSRRGSEHRAQRAAARR